MMIPSATVRKCFRFAAEICQGRHQGELDFGRGGLPRGATDQIADTAQGKLAECAFALFAGHVRGIEIKPDFNIYPSEQTTDNNQDIDAIIINGMTTKSITACRVSRPVHTQPLTPSCVKSQNH